MKVRSFLIVLIITFVWKLQAQEDNQNKWVELSGFVNYNVFYDSRENVAAVDGLFLLFPQDNETINGIDIYANPSLTMLSLASRLRANFNGPEVLGARASGKIEADFTLVSGASTVRFRHAYIKLEWQKTSVLAGRTWHPLFVEQCFPSTLGISTGAPFQPFSRTPQLRVDYRLKHFSFQFVLLSQMDYASDGPFGKSPEYMRQAIVPESSLRVSYQTRNILFGVVADLKTIKPRTTTEGLIGTFRATETLTTYSVKLFGKFKNEKWEAKGSFMTGQNLSDMLMAGGYGVSSYDPITGYEAYTPLSGQYSWLNVLYGKQLRFGVFGGYYKNLGAADKLADPEKVWGRGANIDQMIRVMPTFFYRVKNLQLGCEFEWNRVYYGELDMNDGQVKNTHAVVGNRIMADVTYFF